MLAVVSGEVVFLFDHQHHSLSVDDAVRLLPYVVESNLASQWLHSKIRTAARVGGGELALGPHHRDELLRVLDAIEAPTDSERGLRDALRPI
jgi:hypothetical protein